MLIKNIATSYFLFPKYSYNKSDIKIITKNISKTKLNIFMIRIRENVLRFTQIINSFWIRFDIDQIQDIMDSV